MALKEAPHRGATTRNLRLRTRTAKTQTAVLARPSASGNDTLIHIALITAKAVLALIATILIVPGLGIAGWPFAANWHEQDQQAKAVGLVITDTLAVSIG